MILAWKGFGTFSFKPGIIGTILAFNFLNLAAAIILHTIIPYIFDCRPYTMSGDNTAAYVDYLRLYQISISIFLVIGTIILVYTFKSVIGWKSINLEKNMEEPEKRMPIIKKCLRLPYFIYFMQITLPFIIILVCFLVLENITDLSISLICRLEILVITLCTFIGAAMYMISKKILINIFLMSVRTKIYTRNPQISDYEIAGLILEFGSIGMGKDEQSVLKEQQDRLMEKERLAALGQLVGGITHNLRSPIMSISGAVEALRDLVKEYEESIGDRNVTQEDHHEVAKEMLMWVEKIKPQCSYMSELVSAVKDQAVSISAVDTDSFSIGELIKKVDILMNYELKINRCMINKDIAIDLNTHIRGAINNLVQVLNNLIINAIHSYGGREGLINLSITECGGKVRFIISDNGIGIPKEIQQKLFKEMITTKGNNGTGLGLYISYAAIKRFKGDMWFESEEGIGTSFYITVPAMC